MKKKPTGRVGVIDFPSAMAFLLLAVIVCALSCSCSTYKSEFTDADGTHYQTSMVLAPFSRLEGDDAKLSYTWTADGAGSINVGRDVNVLDETAQVEAARAAAGVIAEAVRLYMKGGLPL